MKKIINIISALALIFLASSCESDEGTLFDFGGKDYASFGAARFSFSANAEGKHIVHLYHLSDGPSSTFNISVEGADNLFTVSPTQVTFNAGSKQQTIEISYNRAQLALYHPYTITLSIPGQNYVSGAAFFERQNIVIMYEPAFNELEWEHFATGYFESEFFERDEIENTSEWEQTIEKAVGYELYRLPSLYADGVDFVFKLEDETTGEISIPRVAPDANGFYRFDTGFVHPQHGSVWAMLDPDPDYSLFLKEEGIAVFDMYFRTSAVAFGWYAEFFSW